MKEVSEYMAGKNINLKNLYHICYLIIKWHKENGYDELETRDALFAWGAENHIYINYNVSSMINYVWDHDKTTLSTIESVPVTNEDIRQINRRFDDRKTKLLAFALLCYSKAFSDSNGEFSLSYAELSAWTGLSVSSISKKYIPNIIRYRYAVIVSDNSKFHSKHQKVLNDRNRYKLVEKNNDDSVCNVGNDIIKAFSFLF